MQGTKVQLTATAGFSGPPTDGFVIRQATDGLEKAHGLSAAGGHKTRAVASRSLFVPQGLEPQS